MLLYQVLENFQNTDSICYGDGYYYTGRGYKVLKLCSSLEIAERFLSTLEDEDNYLITIKEDNMYYDPTDSENGPEYYPEIVINRFTIEAIEIE